MIKTLRKQWMWFHVLVWLIKWLSSSFCISYHAVTSSHTGKSVIEKKTCAHIIWEKDNLPQAQVHTFKMYIVFKSLSRLITSSFKVIQTLTFPFFMDSVLLSSDLLLCQQQPQGGSTEWCKIFAQQNSDVNTPFSQQAFWHASLLVTCTCCLF